MTGPTPDALRPLTDRSRDLVYVLAGLGVLGLQRFQAERSEIASRLEDYGLDQAAGAVRAVGDLLDDQIQRLLG